MENSVVERGWQRTDVKDGFGCALRCACAAGLLVLFLPGCHLVAQAGTEAYRTNVLTIQQQIESGSLDAARASIAAALKLYPRDGGLENLLGVVEIQQGHTIAARQAFSAAVRHDPTLLGAYLNLSRIAMETAATDAAARAEAERLCEHVVQLDPANDEAHYQLATLLAWQKNYRRSLDQLSRLSTGAQSAIGAVALACQDHAALSDTATVQAVATLAANSDLTEQDAFVCIPALRTVKRADLIAALLEASSAHRPLSANGLHMLGLAQEAGGNLAEARATLESAFAADSASIATLVDLTRVARAAGDNQGALGYLAHARELAPKDAALPYEFGVICLQMGLYAEARKAIGAALELEPDNAVYNLGMGLVVSYSEDPSQAMPYLKKYHALRPQAADGILALGGASFRAKEYDAAAEWLKQATAHAETAAEAHYYLGRIARQEGRLDEAKSELNECLRLHPDQASVLAELGQIAVNERDYTKAEADLQRAVELDGENYAANFGLLQLYARTNDPRREQQTKRFEQIKDKKDERDLQMMRSIEIRRDGEPSGGHEADNFNH
jgi:tetratricopeptide (TPR) repeat protein